MIFDKQLKIYDTGVFKRLYRRDIVINELFYVGYVLNAYSQPIIIMRHISFTTCIYEYTTDSGPVAMVMPWTYIQNKNQQTGSYIYIVTKVTLKCIYVMETITILLPHT